MADFTPIALAVKPVDVATPLLQAQRIRSMQMEEQQQRDAMVKQAAGDWARGVAVYADKPEFAQKWAEGLDQLHANGMMPTQAYQSIRDAPSLLMLQQIIAQTTDPRLAFQQKQADRSFGLQQQQFEESKRTSQRDFELRERELAAKRATEPWMPGPDGSLVPRQGGPADPSYQAKLDESKKETPDKIRILRAAGIDPTSPEGRQALFKLDEKLTPTDRKAIQNAEDENTILENTVEALKLAQDLNEKTFTGWTASMRGTIGTKMPGGGVLVDENAAKATQEWDKIMQSEAIQNMSKTLKGASTDFEMRKFVEQLADTSTDPEIRGRIIQRLLKLAERQREVNQTRMDQLRGGTYYKPGGGMQPAPAKPGGVIKWEIGPDGNPRQVQQ